MKWFGEKRGWVILLVMGLALALRLYMMVAGTQRIPVSSDEAITILQAKEIIGGDPSLFVWAQPYQFPMETYMVAPIVNLLPRNAFGARFHSFVIGFLSMAVVLGIFWRIAPLERSWIGIVLALFPSAYMLMIQFGYPVPHYTPIFLFWGIAILLIAYRPDTIELKALALTMVAGLMCGLAFTNNLVSVALVVPLAVVACWGRGVRDTAIKIPVFSVGAFVGLLPYLLGPYRCAGGIGSVEATCGWRMAMSRIWKPALSQTIPRALGADPGLYPDSRHTLLQPDWVMMVVTVFFIVVLLVATGCCLWRVVKVIASKKWPRLWVGEVVVGACWISLVMFLLSSRASARSYRYVAPIIWCFPFVVYYAGDCLPRRLKGLFSVLVIVMVCFNVVTSACLISRWNEHDYAARVVGAPDLKPTLDFLEEKGIEHCVASHWAAYRIGFLSDEKIICSQPYNERFVGWPIPYKSEVDAATNVAFVLTRRIRFMKPSRFERHLRTMEVTAKQETKGYFEIYYDFEQASMGGGEIVSWNGCKASASSREGDAARMIDGDQKTVWRSDGNQLSEMWIEVELVRAMELKRLLVYCGSSYKDVPRHMVVETKSDDGWQELSYRTFGGRGDKFRFVNGHPAYGPPGVQTLILGEAGAVSAFRLRIIEPAKTQSWTISELELWAK